MAPRVNRKNLEKYFDFVYDQARCKICCHSLKSDRIFNLKTHAVKVHKIKEDEFITGNNSVEGDTVSKITKHRKNVIKVEIDKKQLLRSYIGLVTEDNIPFNILNSDNFKKIIDPICRGISIKTGKKFCLNSSNCKKVLRVVADNIRSVIKTELCQRLLSLKIDSATGLSRNLFGISAQFIKDDELQCRILGMLELKGAAGTSTSSDLATEILNTLSKYSINLSQIVSITSDNGANMIKTTKIVSHCSSYFDDGQETHDDIDDGNEIYLKNIQLFENSFEIPLGDVLICRSAADTAQLCALDLMKDNEIKNLLLSCRNLVKFIRKPSNGYREIFHRKSLTLPLVDCPTRWGSTYNMMTSLKNAKDVLMHIEAVKNKSIDENFEINDGFWDFVHGYCVAFEPLQHKIIKFQQEQLHYGNFYAEWLKFKLCTEKVLETKAAPCVDKIAKSLSRSMEDRTIELLNNENLISCLYLDPRFNHTLTAKKKLEAVTYLKTLYERINSLNKYTAQKPNTAMTPLALQPATRQFSQKADEYLNEYLTQNFRPPPSDSIDVYKKIENLKLPFVRVDSNVLHFWRDKQYSDPELYALSSICFAVPSTQVIVEPAFSSLKLMLADNRNRINQDTFENTVLVKLNAGLLDQAIEALPLYADID